MSLSPDGHLQSYTIYRRPEDYPSAEFVVRAFVIGPSRVVPAPDILGTASTLDEARALIPPEADAMLVREEFDHPTVVETWI